MRRRKESNWYEDSIHHRDYERLAVYNAEVYRGILHTREYDDEMAKVQERFNNESMRHLQNSTGVVWPRR